MRLVGSHQEQSLQIREEAFAARAQNFARCTSDVAGRESGACDGPEGVSSRAPCLSALELRCAFKPLAPCTSRTYAAPLPMMQPPTVLMIQRRLRTVSTGGASCQTTCGRFLSCNGMVALAQTMRELRAERVCNSWRCKFMVSVPESQRVLTCTPSSAAQRPVHCVQVSPNPEYAQAPSNYAHWLLAHSLVPARRQFLTLEWPGVEHWPAAVPPESGAGHASTARRHHRVPVLEVSVGAGA